MSTEKSWYTGIKNARGEGTDSKDIADWFKEGDSDLNPYNYREVPKDMVSFYLYLIQFIKSMNAPDMIQELLNKVMKNILKQSLSERYKVFFCIAMIVAKYDAKCESLQSSPSKSSPKCSQLTILPRCSDYLPFITNSTGKLGNILLYFNTINLDTIISTMIKNTENLTGDPLFTEFYELFLENLATIKITNDPNDTAKAREEYLVKILLFLIDIAPQQYYKEILENLPSYADIFPTNFSGERVLSRPLLETFKKYILSLNDEVRQKTSLYLFFSKLLEMKDNRSITNETLLYDAFNFIRLEDDTRPYPTYMFRHDFDRKRGIANEFRDDELLAIDTCFSEQRTNFSSFMNILNTNNTKQGVIDSLLIAMPACKAILSSVGVDQTQEKQLDLTDTSGKEEMKKNLEFLEEIANGNKNKVAEMISAGININSHIEINDGEGIKRDVTPLLYAIIVGKTEIANLLLRKYANADEQCYDGNTALIIAAHTGNIVLVQNLLLLPVDVTVKNDDGLTALNIASISEPSSNMTLIVNLLTAAMNPGGIEAVQQAIEAQANTTVSSGAVQGKGQQTQVPGQQGHAASVLIVQYPDSLSLEERKVIALEQIAKINEKKYILNLLLAGKAPDVNNNL